MLKIGCQLSIAEGYLKAAKTALSIGANVFQYFSRNPQGYAARKVDLNDIKQCDKFMDEHNLSALTHGPYTLNLAAYDLGVRIKGENILEEDLTTLDIFGGGTYVFHPGAHTVLKREDGISFIHQNLNEVLNANDFGSMVLLETMSGRGSEIGCTLEELKTIIDYIDKKSSIGVCIDTCHMYSAGYDIVNDLDGVLEKIEKSVGLYRICAVHLNDSRHPFGSKKDMHAKLGEGTIGKDAIIRIINNKYLKDLPFFLETPCKTLDEYKDEINFIKENYNG